MDAPRTVRPGPSRQPDALARTPWKIVLSSKGILPILYELSPDCPYLLRAETEPFGADHVSKPIHSREGSNVTIVRGGRTVAETGGDYGDGPRIYQELCPLAEFGGRHVVVGSWMVNGHACGMGLREDDGPITKNTSRFVPHLFRKSRAAKPPLMGPSPFPVWDRSSAPPITDPLWDRWLDR